MGNNNGFISLWRKLRENPIYSNSKATHIWVECLFRATYKQRTFYQNRTKIELEPGQFLMGYREFSNKLNLGTSTVKYWLDKFEEVERMIERKSNAKGTIVTILNWDEYQEVERKVEREENASETQVESNNKVNKGNKVNNNTKDISSGKPPDDSNDPKFPENSTEYQLALNLRTRLTDFHDPTPRLPDPNPTAMSKWSYDIDKLLRLGEPGGEKSGPTPEQTEFIIHWIYDINDFWRNTIKSPHGIRKNLTTITAQIRKWKRNKTEEGKFDGKTESQYLKEL